LSTSPPAPSPTARSPPERLSPLPDTLLLLRQTATGEGRRLRGSLPAGSVVSGRGRTTLARAEVELAALAQVLPLSLIHDVISEAGKEARRRRKLPPDLVTWLVIGMGLFRDLSIPNVLLRVVDGLKGSVSWGLAEIPCETSLAHARDRLGWETIRELFRRFADLLFVRHSAATTWKGLAVYVLDGVCMLCPDTPVIDAAFGRAGVTRGGAKSGFPQLRGVLLVAAWSHLVVRAAFGPYRKGELTLAHELAPQLPAHALVLFDRAYYSFAWLDALVRQKAHFVVRARTKGRVMKARRTRQLGQGDLLGTLVVPHSTKEKNPSLPDEIQVRVVTYRPKGHRQIKLVTNLVDPVLYPAADLAALYRDRWEVEFSFRELKTHLVGNAVVFRSRTRDRVLQEAYGLLLAYNCVRALMAEAAARADVQPRRLSFVGCLERIRAALPNMATAESSNDALDALLDSLVRLVLRERRDRRSPRAVKIKMSNYPRKRPGIRAVARTR
jgi:hypothetical protein